MSDAHAHLFSMRRSKDNFFRLMSVLSGPLAVGRWLSEVCAWKEKPRDNCPGARVTCHACMLPRINTTDYISLHVFGRVVELSVQASVPAAHEHAAVTCRWGAHPDELDEEFDTFPTNRALEWIRMRYDRLRSVAHTWHY